MSTTPRLFLVLAASLLTIALLTTHTSLAAFIQTYQATGNLQVEVAGAANLVPPAMGTVTLTGIPSGTIKRAYFYATQTNNTLGLSLTFNGAPLGTAGPYASEALLITLSTYRWDVTSSIIPGVASYGFSVLDGMGIPVAVAGVGLVVVWEDVSEPLRTVTIVDGVKQVGESGAETESMTFTGLPSGNTTVWIFTTDDDSSTGETVSYNAVNIGGPLIGNLGLNASVLQMTGTSVLGSNTLSISTVTDHLTWVLGVTAIGQSPVPAEESTWGKIKSLYR
ncbi:MAG: hypothetical protein JSW50_16515 [Candidatus Latescibacterota bacterium]|nr:MAG: hypothetical protein JSW50_16515 [Candidatus Latescibacterota bacterium]